MSKINRAVIYHSDKNYKYHSIEFLEHEDEPKENLNFESTKVELEANTLRSNFAQKRRLRRIARRLKFAI